MALLSAVLKSGKTQVIYVQNARLLMLTILVANGACFTSDTTVSEVGMLRNIWPCFVGLRSHLDRWSTNKDDIWMGWDKRGNEHNWSARIWKKRIVAVSYSSTKTRLGFVVSLPTWNIPAPTVSLSLMCLLYNVFEDRVSRIFCEGSLVRKRIVFALFGNANPGFRSLLFYLS